jgi:2-polyprenyl-3-methyl-5-hydroxy-6-metoxy-1,4-benzoquinol methylase
MQLRTVDCVICGAGISDTRLVYHEFGLNVVRCRRCGLVYVNPRLDDTALDTVYGLHTAPRHIDGVGEDRTREEKVYRAHEDRLIQQRLQLIEKMRHGKAGRVLDVGSHYGHFLVQARLRGWTGVGVEIASDVAAQARETHNLTIYNDKIENVDFGEERFDLVTLFDVLEHLQDPNRVLQTIYSVLADDGILFIKVPNVQFIRLKTFVLSRLLGRDAHKRYDFLNPLGFFMVEQHNYNFSDQTLTRLLAENGYQQLQSFVEFPSIYGRSKGRDGVQIVVWLIGKLLYYASLGRLNINRSLLYAFRKTTPISRASTFGLAKTGGGSR